MKPNQIICGDNIDVVKPWPSNCIDGIYTDPPYELGFMGKGWDSSGIAYSVPMWKQMLRITKPGGFLLCFGGTRTYHRLACAIEDAGWEIRDCMMWLYGSGFPKSHNISKAIDKAKGAERKVVGKKDYTCPKADNTIGERSYGISGGRLLDGREAGQRIAQEITTPATNLAQLWDGYGTALKPAWEPILVCMKPLDGTFAHNAEAHGVAGLNIDSGRIGTETRKNPEAGFIRRGRTDEEVFGSADKNKPDNPPHEVQGRWPANLILDEEAGAMLDEQTGNLGKSSGGNIGVKGNEVYGKYGDSQKGNPGFGDSGGASRFFKVLEPESCFLCGYTEEHGNLEVGPGVFLCDECLLRGEALDLPKRFLYCAKTSRKERNMGMEDSSGKKVNDGRQTPIDNPYQRGETIRKNTHPTVKPLALMKYLCTLLKMPSAEQIILDPFMGSGTTGMACKELGINFIGIEKEREYCEIAIKRTAAVLGQEITLHTETTLPVSKNVETFRTTTDSAGGGRCPNESLPHVSESRQRIIDAASAELHKKRISPVEGLK